MNKILKFEFKENIFKIPIDWKDLIREYIFYSNNQKSINFNEN